MKRFFHKSVAQIGFWVVFTLLTLTLFSVACVYLFEATYIGGSSRRLLNDKMETSRHAFQKAGAEGLQSYIEELSESSDREDSLHYLFLNDRGQKSAGDLNEWPDSLQDTNEVRLFWAKESFFSPSDEDDPKYWPALSQQFDDGSRLLIVHHFELIEEFREVAIPALWLTFSFSAAGALILVYAVRRSLLAKVERLNATIKTFQEGDYSQRAPVDGGQNEFDILSEQLNSMFGDTERLITGMRRVTSDVAHDLRSPVTRLKTRMEVTLLNDRTPAEYQSVLQDTLEDISLLSETFNSLLYIGQLEAERAPLTITPIDLSSLSSNLVSLYDDPQNPITTSFDQHCTIKGDHKILQQLVGNLLENALKFSPTPGSVTVSVTREADDCVLTIADKGPGIPENKRKLVWERFYRAEEARSTPGNGLGLALVRAAADILKGRLELRDNEPGLIVEVRFAAVDYLTQHGAKKEEGPSERPPR